MRIISYNINGLNAFHKNGKLDELITTYPADIYCLQEVKTDDKKCVNIFEQHSELSNYTMFGCVSDKKGYAGVAFLIRKDIKYINEFKYTINYKEQVNVDGEIVEVEVPESIYTTGRIVCAEFEKFYLVNVYVVNSGNKQKIRNYFDAKFTEFLKSLDKPFIVCGDFNVCAYEEDYWGNYNRSIDSGPGLYRFEIDNFREMLTELNVVDAFRYINGKQRKYSWFSTLDKKSVEKGHGWRIDYFLVSSDIASNIENCDIVEGYQGRDHSPIILDFKNPE